MFRHFHGSHFTPGIVFQERQNEGCKEIPRVISSLYVNIIQNIMGNPPDLTVLKAVCEFLIAVHPTDDISRLHAPSRCYLREHSLDLGMLISTLSV